MNIFFNFYIRNDYFFNGNNHLLVMFGFLILVKSNFGENNNCVFLPINFVWYSQVILAFLIPKLFFASTLIFLSRSKNSIDFAKGYTIKGSYANEQGLLALPTAVACDETYNIGACNFYRTSGTDIGLCCDETGPDATSGTADDIDCAALAGDGTCDEACNTGACNNDGGDCV